jgi:ABC-2 type transport system permease protein
MLAKPLAFLRRDLGIAVTYRLSFVQSIFVMFLGLVSFNFVSTFINDGAPPSLAPYGNNYFTYGLVGMSIALFSQSVVGIFPATVRNAQVTGTLEVILASHVSLQTFLAGSALYGLVYSLVRLIAVLVIGALVFGAAFQLGGAAVALLVFLLTVCIFAGAGILASAFVLWFKQQEPFTGAFITLSLLFSGVVYPTSVLPAWLETLSQVLPLTHTIDALRATLLQGSGIDAVADELAVLAVYALVLPISLGIFGFAVKHARVAGSLGQY